MLDLLQLFSGLSNVFADSMSYLLIRDREILSAEYSNMPINLSFNSSEERNAKSFLLGMFNILSELSNVFSNWMFDLSIRNRSLLSAKYTYMSIYLPARRLILRKKHLILFARFVRSHFQIAKPAHKPSVWLASQIFIINQVLRPVLQLAPTLIIRTIWLTQFVQSVQIFIPIAKLATKRYVWPAIII